MYENEYYSWLMDRVGFTRKGYDQLFLYLFSVPFSCVIDRDMNRMEDAKSLIYEYGENVLEYISVLEVLIALAIRIDDEYIGDPADPNPDIIFWEMICNLGLNKFDDKHFNVRDVFTIIDDWMKRRFDYDGTGSIFPLKDPHQDQTKIELWSQLQEYLSENY